MEQIRIIAPNLQEAMAQVKSRLGEDATIISWNNLGDAIEVYASGTVIASNNGNDKQTPHKYNKPDFGNETTTYNSGNTPAAPLEEFQTRGGTAPRYDVFAHEEKLIAEKVKAEKLRKEAQKQKELAERKRALRAYKEKTKKPNAKRGVGVLLGNDSDQKVSNNMNEAKIDSADGDSSVNQNHTDITQADTTKANERAPLHPLLPLLVKSGLSLKEIKPFASYFKYETETTAIDLFTKILGEKYEYDPLPAAPEHAIALIGSAGSGKTAIAAKIAARAISSGVEVLLISTDTERQGGVEQLRGFAKKLGAGFNYADNISEAEHLVRGGLDAGKVVIVDCASTSFIEPASMRVLERLINETNAEPILCLPTDMRPDDIEDMVAAFKDLGVKRCILTRTDLTNRRAGPLKGLLTNPLKISLISASPFIAGGIVIASPQRLAGLVLDPFADI